MAKVITDEQGRVILSNNKALTVQGTSPDIELPKYTGHVDTEGLTALGWDSYDIAWLQAHVWWDEEDDEYWAVTEANLAFGPNGATPLTWANRASIKTNSDVRYFPKFDPSPSSDTSWSNLFANYIYLCAIPTHGWDTSNVTSLNSAFSYAYSLCSIGDISYWDVTKVTNMSYLFFSCHNLLDVGNLDSWNTANNTNMTYMFNSCFVLNNIGDLSQWNVGKVTSMQNAFFSCRMLTSVGDLSNWDISNVTTITGLFYGCSRMVFIGNLSDWDTSKVVNMGSVFYNCYLLHSVGDLSKWDTSKVTNMANMFCYCYSLSDVLDLSDWDTSNVTDMSYMIGGGDSHILKIKVNEWDLSSLSKIDRLFWACHSLTELDLTGWDTSSVTSVGTSAAMSPFSDCRSLRTLKLGPNFFNFSPSKIYINQCYCWTRDSIYESLYTNQTLRNTSSPAKTVALSAAAYNSLSVQDREDIATKNITLTRE